MELACTVPIKICLMNRPTVQPLSLKIFLSGLRCRRPLRKYLFIGDSDLWYFAFDLESKQFVVLSRSTLEPVHSFGSAAEMINDMLMQALRINSEEGNASPPVPNKTVNG